jgi:IPT/TIG domain-containing protein
MMPFIAVALFAFINPDPPFIDDIRPPAASPGTTITLIGGNFDNLPRSLVAFGTTASAEARAPLVVVSSSTITTVVPARAISGPVYILGPNGRVLVKSSVQFTVVPPPTSIEQFTESDDELDDESDR